MIDVAPTRWGGHHLFLGRVVDQASTGVVAWTERGLDRASKLLYAGSAFDGIDELVEALAGAGVDAAPAAAAGQLVVVEPDRFYSTTGYRALVDEARRQGFGEVSSFGGPAAARGLLDDAAFERFERVLEEECGGGGVSAVCCYDPAADGGDELQRAVARHASSWSGRLLHAHSPGPGRLQLVGEIDAANDRVLAAVCAAALERSGPELVLDCDGLSFMSVSGWRALHATTSGFRDGGGRVRLAGLNRLPMRTLSMMGYERAFELETGR